MLNTNNGITAKSSSIAHLCLFARVTHAVTCSQANTEVHQQGQSACQ